MQYYMRPKPDNSDYYQIDRYHVIENAGHQQDQDAGDQRHERLYGNDVDRHQAAFCQG
jgi:hypothetical protein